LQIDWNRASSAGGTGNVENVWKESLHRDPFARDDRRRAFVWPGQAVAADDVTEDQIVRALAPQEAADPGLSSGPQADPAAIAEKAVSSRPSAAAPRVRSRAASAKKSPPSPRTSRISIWKSPSITTRPISAQIAALGSGARQGAYQSRSEGLDLRVAGHTDAAGGESYNQDLSERRADSIKRYLTDKYGINGADLVTVGYGKSKLKDPAQPLAEANRRVQVVNMATTTTASK
jgi:outer membrane protein OmpA-like peptidoglycan-associated protein